MTLGVDRVQWRVSRTSSYKETKGGEGLTANILKCLLVRGIVRLNKGAEVVLSALSVVTVCFFESLSAPFTLELGRGFARGTVGWSSSDAQSCCLA